MQTLTISVIALFKKEERKGEGYRKAFILSSIAIYFLPLSLIGFSEHGFYDRYLVPLLPLWMILVSLQNPLGEIPFKKIRLEFIGILAIGVLTVGAMHDYLSWNRARWTALRYLMHKKDIAPSLIDGGFEFNGSYLYRADYQKKGRSTGKNWYWVEDDKYAVALGVAPGYKVIRSYPYNHWLPVNRGPVYVLEKLQKREVHASAIRRRPKPTAPPQG
jgi:hypothetical protein